MQPTVVWRHPKKRHAQAPLVLFLHGRGADEYDLLDLADGLPSRCAFASIRAPVPLPQGGYTWFESRGVAQPIGRSLHASVADLRAWIEEAGTSTYHGPLVLLGFSAGMMMAGAMILAEPTLYAGAVLLSGALAFDGTLAVAPRRLAGLPVFYGAGLLDEVIPGDLALRSAVYLREQSGATLTMREYPIGHTISRAEISDIATWLDDVV